MTAQDMHCLKQCLDPFLNSVPNSVSNKASSISSNTPSCSSGKATVFSLCLCSAVLTSLLFICEHMISFMTSSPLYLLLVPLCLYLNRSIVFRLLDCCTPIFLRISKPSSSGRSRTLLWCPTETESLAPSAGASKLGHQNDVLRLSEDDGLEVRHVGCTTVR